MAKCIMIQGTQSDAGKSLLAAGLCRIFHQDGYRVVPFKSQNMSLNAYVTPEGKEMSIAQALQAQAAGLTPDVRMNPIMLKPLSMQQTEVVLNGDKLWQVDSQTYYQRKKELLAPIRQAYDELAAEADIMVIEGAGSPAEINLSDDDIVNMGMARLVDAPVLLAANIDLGGVFASIYGTIMLQTEADRRRFQGIIINKFRGDRDLLQPGLDQIEALTGVPVVGVVPFTPFDLEDEDSVAIASYRTTKDPAKDLDVAILAFPWVANFSDFKSLEQEGDLSLRCVFDQGRIGQPDLLILPDSRSFAQDLAFLKDHGFDEAIRAAYAGGSHILALGGGGFLLAQQILDPTGGHGGVYEGLGLLPLTAHYQAGAGSRQLLASTTFPSALPEDLQVFHTPLGHFAPAGDSAEGGSAGVAGGACGAGFVGSADPSSAASVSAVGGGSAGQAGDLAPFARIHQVNGAAVEDGAEANDGVISADGRILVTSFHGLLDNSHWRRAYLNLIRQAKGLAPITELRPSWRDHREAEFDRLADLLRENLDMDAIYGLMGLEGRKA